MTTMDVASPQFWIAVVQIIAIDILLGGDNAVVIALACRRLPEAQRSQGILWGVVGAIVLRIVLIAFALHLLGLPYLKAIGACLLLWIGVKVLQPEESGGQGHSDGRIEGAPHLLGAIRTIVLADAAMSLDNVVAVAGAAKGHLSMVVFGITVSIPIIALGSRIVLRLMDRFPVVITLGAALLGWIAGDMLVSDAALTGLLGEPPTWVRHVAAVAGALFVVVLGLHLARRAAPRHGVELAVDDTGPSNP